MNNIQNNVFHNIFWASIYIVFFLGIAFLILRSRQKPNKIPSVMVLLTCLIQIIQRIILATLWGQLETAGNISENYWYINTKMTVVSDIAQIVTDLLITLTIVCLLYSCKEQLLQNKTGGSSLF